MGRHHGSLKEVRPDISGARRGEVVRRAGLDPAIVEEVLPRCANQAGGQPECARMPPLLAGFPVSVAGVTFNRLCSSGLSAINAAARAIKAAKAMSSSREAVESMTARRTRSRRTSMVGQEPDGLGHDPLVRFPNRAQGAVRKRLGNRHRGSCPKPSGSLSHHRGLRDAYGARVLLSTLPRRRHSPSPP